MTNKQTIVDGVDVSECEFYWLEKDLCNNGNLTGDCQENKDCIYKRYIRKEQECERLSSIIRKTQTYKDICCDCRDEILLYPSISGKTNYTQIEVEERSLERIIQQLEAYKMEAEEGKEINAELKAENEELKEKINSLVCSENCYKYKQAEKYKQTLTEIKDYCNKYPQNSIGFKKQILQKISEVQDE